MSGKVKCSCGHSWNKSDSSKKDMNVCHICGKDNTMKDGGWLDKYQGGGKVQAASVDSSKAKQASKQTENQLPIYYGPMEFENCQGAGCSKIATTEIANTFGMNYGDLHPQDAWYRRSSVLKNKGKEVWNPSMGNNYSGFKVGDLISLNRPGDTYEKTASKTPGYTMADNEGNEHVGEIVGKTKEGVPLIKHGSEHGKIYVQPINNVFLSDAAPVTLKYKPQSVYRLAELENAEIKDKKFYIPPAASIPITWKNPNRKLTANEKKYIDAINANAGKQQQMFGLSPEEAKMINTLGYGIFHNESNAGNTSWKRPVGGKMLASELAHAFGREASPSLGDVQFKYDDMMYNKDKSLSNIGKRMQNIGVTREGLSDWTHHRDNYNDEVNSVAALMSDYLDKFKNNPKYKYDPKKKTVFGDIPIDKALINIYHFGPAATKEKFLRNAKSYSDKAMKYINELNYTPETPKNIHISKNPNAAAFMNAAKVAKRENGGWLDKYNDGGPVQENYNNYSVSAPKGFQGDGYSNVGRNYSPAWGGQFAMGGSMPGAVGFTYARTINPAPSNGPYAKKTKASAQDGANVETVYSGMLPEITVVGSKDPQTEEFYRNMMDRLTKEEGSNYGIMKNNDIYSDPNPETLNMVFDNPISSGNILGRYQGLMDLGKKYGFPKVHPKDPNSIFAVASKLSDTELELGPRPNYNPFTKTIQASTSKNWLDEMAHHVQFKNNPISTGVKFLTNDVPAYISGKSPYTTSGTMEHEAHSIIEPKLEEEIETSKRNYRQLPYIQKLTEQFYGPIENYQNGGEMRYYQEGLDFQPKTISRNGSVIKDDMGQWAHPGEITEIGSNQITMQGVPYPVLGISDTGDTQMMYPNQEYQYEGSSVTEYPMMKEGGALQLVKLDQLTNFTNYNTKQPGGWLSKYE